jgi:Fe-S oxidoreductase
MTTVSTFERALADMPVMVERADSDTFDEVLRERSHTVALLERAGYDVVTSDVECCGMASSFGYKSEYYDLSMAVGDDLHDQFTAPETEERILLASGTSYIDQMNSLFDRPSYHPVRVISPEKIRVTD